MLPTLTNRTVNPAELAKAVWDTDEELEIQARIVAARHFHEGQFSDKLYEEIRKRVVGQELPKVFTAVNLSRMIVNTLRDRLSLTGLQISDEEQAVLFAEWWKYSRMSSNQHDIYTWTLRDQEAFVILAFERPNAALGVAGVTAEAGQIPGRVTFHVKQRYTDPQVGGDGDGCRAHYEDGRLAYVTQRWAETVWRNKKPFSRLRLTIYLPDRTERYVDEGKGWAKYRTDPADTWPITWVDAAGRPVGVPVVHFTNEEERPEARDAWGLHLASDHTIASLLIASQMQGFPMLWANFYPTTDGKPPNDDRSNVWQVGPASIVGNAEMGKDGKLDRIPPGDLSQLINAENQWLMWTAASTSTPALASTLALGQNISGETLKQFDVAQVTKAERLQSRFGDKWEEVAEKARVIYNAFAAANLKPTVYNSTWRSAETRDRRDRMAESAEKRAAGVPEEQLWIEFGYSQEDIVALRRQRAWDEAMKLLTPWAERGNPAALDAMLLIFAAWRTQDQKEEEAAWAAVETALRRLGTEAAAEPAEEVRQESQ